MFGKKFNLGVIVRGNKEMTVGSGTRSFDEYLRLLQEADNPLTNKGRLEELSKHPDPVISQLAQCTMGFELVTGFSPPPTAA